MYRCLDCGNTEGFLTERWYLCWVKVDGEGRVTSRDDVQGEEDSHLDPDPRAYIECYECVSTNVEEE